MKYDSIIFDLDGTLWDPTSSILESWNEVIEEQLGTNISIEDLKGIMGMTSLDIAVTLFPQVEKDEALRIFHLCCESEQSHLEKNGALLYERLEETLTELQKNYKLYIVSNCQDGYIETFFKYHKLQDYFHDYECHGRTGLHKGENIKSVIERNNLQNPIYVGDTVGDLKGSRFANIPFVYARYGFAVVDEYDYVVDSFKEILHVI